jgi:hypothetical protein
MRVLKILFIICGALGGWVLAGSLNNRRSDMPRPRPAPVPTTVNSSNQ